MGMKIRYNNTVLRYLLVISPRLENAKQKDRQVGAMWFCYSVVIQ